MYKYFVYNLRFSTEIPEGQPHHKVNKLSKEISVRWHIMSAKEKDAAMKEELAHLHDHWENKEVVVMSIVTNTNGASVAVEKHPCKVDSDKGKLHKKRVNALECLNFECIYYLLTIRNNLEAGQKSMYLCMRDLKGKADLFITKSVEKWSELISP